VWARERAAPTTSGPRASIVDIIARRRQTAGALLFAALVGFGAGHATTRAWLRAFALSVAQAAAPVVSHGDLRTFLALTLLVRSGDVIGSLARIWWRALPPAA
jgi:hypothetical protein